MEKNNDTKDYSEQLEFLKSTLLCEQKIVNQSSDFPVRRTGSYRHKKALDTAYIARDADDVNFSVGNVHCAFISAFSTPLPNIWY